MKNFLIGLVLVLLMSSCLDTALDANDVMVQSDINYLSPISSKENFPNDPYRIISITPITLGQWSIVTEYGGGCEDHVFYTWWDGTFQESNPKRVQLHLLHNGLGDECKAIVRDTVLIQVPEAFQNQYDYITYVDVKNETIAQTVTVDPFITDYVLIHGCGIPVMLEDASCSNGFWQNKWIHLTDSLAYSEEVWFQPVKGPSDLATPDFGEYRVGVQLLFGYDYGYEDLTCNSAKPKQFPVRIACIEGS